MPTQQKKKRPVVDWDVDIQFYAFNFKVRARTAGESKRKAFEKAMRKGRGLIDHRNTFIEKV